MDALRQFVVKSSAEQELMMLDSPSLDVEEARAQWQQVGLTVSVLRGWKMRSVEQLFDQLESALQLPIYFGRNAPALDEVLRDFWWMPTQVGRVIILDRPDDVLVDEGDRLGAFHDVFASFALAKEYWARQEPSVPFNLVLAEVKEPDIVESEWAREGWAVHRSPSFAAEWFNQS